MIKSIIFKIKISIVNEVFLTILTLKTQEDFLIISERYKFITFILHKLNIFEVECSGSADCLSKQISIAIFPSKTNKYRYYDILDF